jgi:hypothetical protein
MYMVGNLVLLETKKFIMQYLTNIFKYKIRKLQVLWSWTIF